MLLVDDPIPIQVAIDDLRRSLGFAPRDEFRFSHASADVRRRFLRELRRHPVRLRGLVVDKTTLPARYHRDKSAFYDAMLRLILSQALDSLAGATLVLDESVQSKRRQRTRATFLRQALHLHPDGPRVQRIVHHASHTDNLIQAADMVSGAIFARFSRSDGSYLEIIRARIEQLWVVDAKTL